MVAIAPATPAHADGAPESAAAGPWAAPVDVVVEETPAERRYVALEWNPVALFIDRLSANLEIVPADHHALVLSPFYFDTRTAMFTEPNGGQVPSQRFKGVGGEIGYRYYAARGGPRGFFIGPSFVIANVNATPATGPAKTIMDYGIALDVGWQALLASRWVIGIGGGAEYVFTSESLPDQQAPASYYADSGLHPRALAEVGCAF